MAHWQRQSYLKSYRLKHNPRKWSRNKSVVGKLMHDKINLEQKFIAKVVNKLYITIVTILHIVIYVI